MKRFSIQTAYNWFDWLAQIFGIAILPYKNTHMQLQSKESCGYLGMQLRSLIIGVKSAPHAWLVSYGNIIGTIKNWMHLLISALSTSMTLVYPILEYAIPVFRASLYYRSENVQKRSTRLITSLRELPYTKHFDVSFFFINTYTSKRGQTVTIRKVCDGIHIFNRVINCWNSLTDFTINADSLRISKTVIGMIIIIFIVIV